MIRRLFRECTVILVALVLAAVAAPMTINRDAQAGEPPAGRGNPQLNSLPRMVGFKAELPTDASTTKDLAFNAVAGLPTSPSNPVSRYTFTFAVPLRDAAPDTDTIQVFTAITSPDNSLGLVGPSLTIDPAGFLPEFLTVGPIAGVNVGIRVIRGADGLGPRPLYVNGVVETLP